MMNLNQVLGSIGLLFVLVLTSSCFSATGSTLSDFSRFSRLEISHDEISTGTKWAVLIAGTNGYSNYRHQADVCHAYQLLKKGGLKDENIVVFMYDDIASNAANPHPGVIINKPNGDNVYQDVPKDYTGKDVNRDNILAAILGNNASSTGGSGKVVSSGPEDSVFIFYSGSGGPGVLSLPNAPHLYSNDLIGVLNKKHAKGGYKSMLIYTEAPSSATIYDGLLLNDTNIYAQSSTDVQEDSWATYCIEDANKSKVCLASLYGAAWLEDTELHDRKSELLRDQYRLVKNRTLNANPQRVLGSHVMQFGDVHAVARDHLDVYMGDHASAQVSSTGEENFSVKWDDQLDTDYSYLMNNLNRAPKGSIEQIKALKELDYLKGHRNHIDNSVHKFVRQLLGPIDAKDLERPIKGQPVVNDWDCLKEAIRSFEEHCGSLSYYGLRYVRSFASICNRGSSRSQMSHAASKICTKIPANPWNSIEGGLSA